jgi:nicotinamidase/pyrazinamidase
MSALVLVDIQNDFLPGGSLAVKNGDKILPIINKLINKNFDVIVASKDWHPSNHGSFGRTHGKESGEVVELHGLKQILWPVHCVQGTHGAEFAPGWDVSKVKRVFHKGTDKTVDSYSTFFDNDHKRATGLEDFLRQKMINNVYLAGLTTDYCIKYSALDAINLGFNVYVISDACQPVNLQESDEKLAYEEMKRAGAHILHSDEIKF